MRWFLAGGLLTLAACSTAPVGVAASPADPPRPLADPRAPIAAWFGQWNGDEGFERKTRFARVAGETFGWRLRVRCTGPVKFREVMKLPTSGDWNFTPEQLPGTTISEDQTTTTTVDYAACKKGWVEHIWTLAEGDPAGTYVITVELDGLTPQTFRPRFVEPTLDH